MQLSFAPSHKTTAYQTSDALVNSDSREKQFTVLRYHVTYNNRCAHKSQEHKITCGIQTHKDRPFKHTPWFPLLPVSPNNLGLVNFINQCKYKIVCDSVHMIWISVKNIDVK